MNKDKSKKIDFINKWFDDLDLTKMHITDFCQYKVTTAYIPIEDDSGFNKYFIKKERGCNLYFIPIVTQEDLYGYLFKEHKVQATSSKNIYYFLSDKQKEKLFNSVLFCTESWGVSNVKTDVYDDVIIDLLSTSKRSLFHNDTIDFLINKLINHEDYESVINIVNALNHEKIFNKYMNTLPKEFVKKSLIDRL